jgi:hypothetical protein
MIRLIINYKLNNYKYKMVSLCLIECILTVIILLMVINILVVKVGCFGENKATANLGYITNKGTFKDESLLS